MKEKMWEKLQDELDNILRITASYPTLHDERKGFRQWRDRLMEMEDGD